MGKIEEEGYHDVTITSATIQESKNGMSVWIKGTNAQNNSAMGFIHLTNKKIQAGENKGKTLMRVNLDNLKQICGDENVSDANIVRDLTSGGSLFVNKKCSFTMEIKEKFGTDEMENQVAFINPVRQSISKSKALDIFAKMGGEIDEEPVDTSFDPEDEVF